MILPNANIDIPEELNTELPVPSKTYRLDNDGKRIAGTVDGKDAVLQSIRKLLTTDKYAWEIYDWAYGNELYTLIGMSKDYISVEAPRLIREALLVDDRIIDVTDFLIEDNSEVITDFIKEEIRSSSLIEYAEGTLEEVTGSWTNVPPENVPVWQRVRTVYEGRDLYSQPRLIPLIHRGEYTKDITIQGTPDLNVSAMAKGKGTVIVHQAYGEQTRVYSVEVDSDEFEQVETRDAVVAGRNLIYDSDTPIDFTDNKSKWSDFGNMTWREVL